MSEMQNISNIYTCKDTGEIPINSMQPGDTLYNSNKKHAFMYLRNGEIIIIENDEYRHEVLYHNSTTETNPKEILFKHAEGKITRQREGVEFALFMFGTPGETIPERKIIFDQSGHLYARDPKLSPNQNHNNNKNNYKAKSSFLFNESLDASKGILLRSDNGKYQLECTSDRREVFLRRVDGKEPISIRIEGAGKHIEYLSLSDDLSLITDSGSKVSIYSGMFVYSLELSDHGALVARNRNHEVLWSTKRNRLSSTDKTFVTWREGKLRHDEGMSLKKGSKLESTNGLYAFEFKHDGNAVLYRTIDKYVLYQTNTSFDSRDCFLTIKGDCLAIEETRGSVSKLLWQEKPTGRPNIPKTCLILSDEGVLSIETDLSESKQVQPIPEIFWRRPLSRFLPEGVVLKKGDWILSQNHKFLLSLQENGNLIIHKNYGRVARHMTGLESSDVLFETYTRFDGPGFLTFEPSTGQLHLKRFDGNVIWSSWHTDKKVERAQLLDDGRIQFFDSHEHPIHELTIPSSLIFNKAELSGRNKLVSPNFRYILSIDELLALDEKDDSERLVIRDRFNNWDDINSKIPGFNFNYSVTSKDRHLIYKGPGISDRPYGLQLTNCGLSILPNAIPGEEPIAVDFPHLWNGKSSLPMGRCMYSPNRKVTLIIEKDSFHIKDLNSGEYLYKSSSSEDDEVESATFFVEDDTLMFGAPKKGNSQSKVLWKSDAKGFSRMELWNDGILRVYDKLDNIVWQSLRVACLAWGSLIWDPRNLPMVGGWRMDGPKLRVEFLRKSSDGRITLVLSKHAKPVRGEWTLMDASSLESAIHGLALREGITNTSASNLKKTIGVWSAFGESPDVDRLIIDIENFAKKHDLTHVIWTNLGPKNPIDGKKNEADSFVIINYLKELQRKADTSGNPLDKLALEKAKEYICRTPVQIKTRYRQMIEEQLGWKYDSVSPSTPTESE